MKKVLVVLFLILIFSSCSCSTHRAYCTLIEFGDKYEIEDNIFIMVNNHTDYEYFEITFDNKSSNNEEIIFQVYINNLYDDGEKFRWSNYEEENLLININYSNTKRSYVDENYKSFITHGSESIYLSYSEASENVKELIKKDEFEFSMYCFSKNVYFYQS